MSARPPGIGVSERAYAALWTIYPQSFRREYGDDALELFRDRYRESYAARGALGVALLWMRALPNVLLHGTLERLGAIRSALSAGVTAHAFSSALRSLGRSPVLAGTIVLTLAVGIGANVALFSVLRGVLLRPLPFEEPERLVTISESNPSIGGPRVGPSPLNFVDWDGAVPALEPMASWWLTSGTYRTDNAAEEVRTAQVTADFFRMLGADALVGRTFVRDEVVAQGPMVLSHGLWQRLYGGDPAIVGGTALVSGEAYRVVGVMPPDFRFPDPTVEAWLAWDMAIAYETRPQARSWRFLQAAGRLAPGASLQEAERQLGLRVESLAEVHPEANRGWSVQLTSLHDELVGEVRATLWVAFGAVTFLLLIACANVANLLLARVPALSRDLAIRASLGASRGTLLGTLAAESILLATAGGVLGLGVGRGLLELLVRLEAGRIPRLEEVAIDGWVLGFALAVSAASCVLFGMAPALQALRGSAFASLRDGRRTSATRGHREVREAFVAAQVAVAIVMLTGAALFRASFARITEVDPGFDPSNVAAFRVSLEAGDVEGSTERYYAGLLDDLRSLPGVVAAGASQTLPMDPVAGDFERPYRAVGASTSVAEASVADIRVVTPGYVGAMRMRVLEGTDFSGVEGASDRRVALINRTLARRLWRNGPAAGEVFELEWQGGWLPYTVAGVVDDIRHAGPREPSREEVYVSHRQYPYLAMSVVVRTASNLTSLTPALRDVVDAQEQRQPAFHFVTMDELRGAAVAEERFLKVLLELFSAIALALVSGGVYGVIAYTVNHRRREIGVRMALGAKPGSVVAGVFGRAALVGGIGAAIGLAIVRLVGGALDGVLFGIAASDPVTSAAGLAVVAAAGALAAWVPARRAARIPPSVALASE